ncbi:RNA polymerase factor sigma-54 [Massilia sp. P8910]|uniref:RNA polymerase factor sigma-54 n=1 Tax=Massilia antarctica TaxID=2765360 RepID=UPI0006BB68A7|nr:MULTISPECIES: RNA polymerase factor sigma-54 [Massilia]MCE3606706.1 RNA polymerase factor sigma-54 [Massilia antarctica]MCY0914966.1 RNA polymerase factor sigma-54 [Massilia sp. H27-R4]CUI06932.1 RNA polymerase sigma-54 factor RpoN [Janthinobacterium sp. CG23_2]CUU30718.1 RNA polymerase sigma-54 factor RpoN [Janthinobacterium sp. CG23_2]
MKQSLQLRTSQHLALTPQLQQSIRLLQLSTLELHQELEQLLSDNPLLERLDDPLDHSVRLLGDGAISSTSTPTEAAPEPGAQDAPAPAEGEGFEGGEADSPASSSDNDGEWGDLGRAKTSDDEDSRPQLEASATTLREHLMEQMRVTVLEARDRALVELIVDAIDDNGYLTETLEEIHERMPPELEIDIDELRTALALLQSFDPVGVGARNASECLALQIRRMPCVALVTRRMALTIVENHLTWFAQREFNKLKKALDCDDEDLREAQTVIRQCNPHPGAEFASDVSDYVVPDVIVRKAKNGWSVMLNNDVMPRLRVNSMYAALLKQGKGEGQMGAQLQEAKWLIKNMRQRFDTILRVAEAIVERQRNFFSHGAVAMRPLVLREIADTLGLHESTISRVTTQKYMMTPHGMFELKYFFGSHVATEAGGEASSTAIRALIVQLTSAEDPKSPLSDSKIADMLGEQGMVIARRTVAKYREALKIPPVALRKCL